jgi:hypothetical protein
MHYEYNVLFVFIFAKTLLMERSPKDTTLRDEKHRRLLESYMETISKYGEAAKYMAKEQLYREAGEKVFLSPVYAGRIIRKMLRKKLK